MVIGTRSGASGASTAVRRWSLRAAAALGVAVVGAGPFAADAARKRSPAPTIWVAPALTKIRPAQPAGTPGTTAQLAAARNEFEAFQIVITGTATDVRAVASDLTLRSAGGDVLYTIRGSRPPAGVRADVHLFRAATITVTSRSSADPESATGAWPDALVPDRDELLGLQRNAFPFSVNRQSSAIWYEVFVPRDAPAGTYGGTVTVSHASGSVTVPVQLTVWGFSLPPTASLRSAFGLAWGALPAGHRFSDADLDTFIRIRHRYGQYALDHRVTLSHIDDGYTYTDLPAFAAAYGDLLDGTAPTRLSGARMTTVEYLGDVGDPAQLDSWSKFFDAKARAATRPWPGDALFQYTCDEPPSWLCSWTDIVSRAEAAHRASPPVRSLVTTDIRTAGENPSSGLSTAQVLDVIVPVVNFMDDKGTSRWAGDQRSTYDAFLADTSLYTPSPGATPVHTGIRRELWSYQSCMSHDCGGASSDGTGWPSYMIDANAIRNRAMQWLLFEYGETGELYYETAHAYGGDPWSDQWAFTGNGDGNLFYPGTDARIGGGPGNDVPVASIRLKMIREGMEDYEYLAMLARYATFVDSSGAVQPISCSDVAGTFQSCRDWAIATARGVFPKMYQANGSPDALMASRARMAAKLAALVARYGQR